MPSPQPRAGCRGGAPSTRSGDPLVTPMPQPPHEMGQWLLDCAKLHNKAVDKVLAVLEEEDVFEVADLHLLHEEGRFDILFTAVTARASCVMPLEPTPRPWQACLQPHLASQSPTQPLGPQTTTPRNAHLRPRTNRVPPRRRPSGRGQGAALPWTRRCPRLPVMPPA